MSMSKRVKGEGMNEKTCFVETCDRPAEGFIVLEVLPGGRTLPMPVCREHQESLQWANVRVQHKQEAAWSAC